MKTWIRRTAIGMAILVSVAVVPFLLPSGEVPLTDAARASAPGHFATLPDGMVHYKWDGPDNGRVVVMVHGFATPSFVFDDNVPALVKAGYRVLRMDNYGRGWSDRPSAPSTEDLYDRQVLGVLDSLHVTQPVDLVGYSMGGAIATAFTTRHADRVRTLSLIAPAGLPFDKPLKGKMATMPGIGEWIMRTVGRRMIINESRKLAQDKHELGDHIASELSQTIGYEGSLTALLSTLRQYPLGGLEDRWQDIARSDKAVAVFWGDADATVPFPGQAKINALMPKAQLTVYPGMGHGIPVAASESFNKDLVTFLQGH